MAGQLLSGRTGTRHSSILLRAYVLPWRTSLQSLPNIALEPTPNSLRSSLAAAAGRGSPRALCRTSSSAQHGRKRSMRHTRIIVTHYGGPDALRMVEEECPEPKDGEVRVRVLAAGVALPDIMARQGVHPETPAVPYTPGWDLVGEVERLGNGVSGLEPGP